VKLDELVNDRESESQAGARGVPIADRVEGDIHRRPTVKDGQLDAMTASMAIVASAVASSPQPRPPSQALAITATTNSGGSAVCVTRADQRADDVCREHGGDRRGPRAGGVIQDRSISIRSRVVSRS
jgi:hypothetical protein